MEDFEFENRFRELSDILAHEFGVWIRMTKSKLNNLLDTQQIALEVVAKLSEQTDPRLIEEYSRLEVIDKSTDELSKVILDLQLTKDLLVIKDLEVFNQWKRNLKIGERNSIQPLSDQSRNELELTCLRKAVTTQAKLVNSPRFAATS